MTRLDARVCFSAAPPARLEPVRSAYQARLISATHEGRPLSVLKRGFSLEGVPSGDCVSYAIDLTAHAFHSRGEVERIGDTLLVSPDVWLWPGPGAEEVRITARFDLPDGFEVSVPWPQAADGTYEVPATTQQWRIRAAFGALRSSTKRIEGARIHIAHLGDPIALEDAVIDAHVEQAARCVAGLYGRFPVDSVQVIVQPVSGDSIVFGATARGGGAGIILFVGRDIDAASLRDDWIVVHELLHLAHPHCRRKDAWFSEGMATYLGPVLRARAGLISPEEVWATLADGFRRGRLGPARRTLRVESEEMHAHRSYWRVYWSGAAMFLLADVAARRVGGRLDDEVGALWRCCASPGSVWKADRIIARKNVAPHLDAVVTTYLDAVSFPDVDAVFEFLGVHPADDGSVRLCDKAPGAEIRRAITAP